MFSKEIRKRLRERYIIPIVCPRCNASSASLDSRENEEIVLVWPVGWSVANAVGVDVNDASPSIELDGDDSEQVDMERDNMPFREKVPSTHLIHRLSNGEVCCLWREEESLVIPPFVQFEKNIVDELEAAGIADPFPYLDFFESDLRSFFAHETDPNDEVRRQVVAMIAEMIDHNLEKLATDKSLTRVFDAMSEGG